MVNYKDVMKKAGVSRGTISRVINNHPDVSDETRKRISDCIQELGYVPNQTARNLGMLKGGRIGSRVQIATKNIVGILYEGFSKFVDPYFNEILQGIDSELFEHGYQLSVYTSGQLKANLAIFSKALSPENTDGVIVLNSPDILSQARDRIKSVVCVNSSEEGFDSVDVDREQGVIKAVRYLAGLGHRKIAFIGYAKVSEVRKHSGYCKALSELGLEYDENIVIKDGDTMDKGYEFMSEFIRKGIVFTAAFISADMAALGAMKALREHGIKIPEDISLVGYDDLEYSKFTSPPLTTVRVDKKNLGILGAKMLLERMNNPAMPLAKTMISTELVIRESCRNLNVNASPA